MGYSDSNSYQANNTHIDTELLSAYIDGEVTAKEAARVEHHIAVCQGCAEELASLRWTVGLLQQVPAVPVPRSFVVRAADLEPEPGRSGRLLPGWLVNGLQWATVATAILAILIFAFDFLAAGPPPAPLPSTAMRALEAQPAQSPVAERETAEERAPERAEPAAGVAGTPVPEAQALEAPAPAADATAPAIVNQTTAPTLRERLRPVEAVLLAVLIILLIASLWARRWRARTADYRR